MLHNIITQPPSIPGRCRSPSCAWSSLSGTRGNQSYHCHQRQPREQIVNTSKQPIRTRYLGHVTGYQPIRDQYYLVDHILEIRVAGLTNNILKTDHVTGNQPIRDQYFLITTLTVIVFVEQAEGLFEFVDLFVC
eukprot:sb/3474833/